MLTCTSAAFVLKIAGCGQQVSDTPYLPSVMCGALINSVLRLWSVNVQLCFTTACIIMLIHMPLAVN